MAGIPRPSPTAVAIESEGEQSLRITSDNGERWLFDAGPYLDDAFFAPLRNRATFRAARCNGLTVEWPGEIDICPDELYINSTSLQAQERTLAALDGRRGRGV